MSALRELLADPARWTKFRAARTADGTPCSVCDSKATCWCLAGGIMLLNPGGDITAQLDAAVEKRGYSQLSTFNDSPDTTHADILAVIEEAEA